VLTIIVPVGNLERDQKNLEKILFERAIPEELELIIVLDLDLRSNNVSEFIHRIEVLGIKTVQSIGRNPNQARLDGLKVATNEFIAFCDSDDVIDLSKLAGLSQSICNPGQVNVFAFERIDLRNSESSVSHHKGSRLGVIRFPGLWRMTFPKESLKSDFFVSATMGEDLTLLSGAILESDEIVFRKEKYYQHIDHSKNRLSSSKNREVYMNNLSEFSLLLTTNLKNVNWKAVIVSSIYTSFVFSTAKFLGIKEWHTIFSYVKQAMSKNKKLGLCIFISFPLVFISRLSRN
jgi:hypothetical protein